MRVLVLAQGAGRRWDQPYGPFLGHPKHFVTVDGETLLERQVRLFAARGCEVVVVGPDDPRYRVPGAQLVTLDKPDPTGTNMDKFLATAPLWAQDGRTVIVWGDCYLTERVADLVADHDDDGYHVWRRPGRSKVTGAKWDESHAVSFGPAEHERVIAAAHRVVELIRSGALQHRRTPGADPSHIRTHLAAMAGAPVERLDDVNHTAGLPMQTHVDDWSDDFDTPREWLAWMRRRLTHDGVRVAVCIPYEPADRWRDDAYKWVLDWYRSVGVPIYTGRDRTGGEHPNRSAMRNDAARQAITDGAHVLFHADADTFVTHDQFWTAAALAHHQRQMVLAFNEYVRIGSRTATLRWRTRGLTVTDAFVNDVTRRDQVWRNHAAGAYAIPVGLWDRVGGYDERFVRWGYEDRALWLAAGTLGGFAQRVHGRAFHWFHPPAPDKDRTAPDSIEAARLAARYYRAAAWVPESGAVLKAIELGLIDPIDLPADAEPDPERMLALLAEPGGPLADQLATVGGA